MAENGDSWERQTLEKLAFSALKEQRKGRHWSIFFKLLGFAYLFIVLFLFLGWLDGRHTRVTGKHTALVDLKGVIASDQASADKILQGLKDAYDDKNTRGVILRINSPGGSPVQAGIIHDEIRRLRDKHKSTPLYVVVEDICASGGYYVAAAAERIYVDKASLIGSIGVLIDGFGLTGTMTKLGVERRLITAGENKAFLDPFSPVKPEHDQYAKKLIEEIHDQFIQVVRSGRGKRLRETPDMFSGLVWNGTQSVQLGLADGLGSVEYVAREIIKAEEVVDFTPEEGFAERFAKRFGAAAGRALEAFASPSSLLR